MEMVCPRLTKLGIGEANSGVIMNTKHTREKVKVTDQKIIDTCLDCSEDCVYDGKSNKLGIKSPHRKQEK